MRAPGLRPFRYPLEPFLRKHCWEEQALRQELATARDACTRLQQEHDRVAAEVQALNEELARMHSDRFDAAQHQRVAGWRGEQEALLQARDRALGEARDNQDRIARQLAHTLGTVRGHEQYRDRLAGEHKLACERDEGRRIDDAWLLRRGWLEGQE